MTFGRFELLPPLRPRCRGGTSPVNGGGKEQDRPAIFPPPLAGEVASDAMRRETEGVWFNLIENPFDG